jgi:hypothetical protein
VIITGAKSAEDARAGGIFGLLTKKCFMIELNTRNCKIG